MESRRQSDSDIEQSMYNSNNATNGGLNTHSALPSSNLNSQYPAKRMSSGEWNRAIPEAGYITLGTIRYGVVKLATNQNPSNFSHSSSSLSSALRSHHSVRSSTSSAENANSFQHRSNADDGRNDSNMLITADGSGRTANTNIYDDIDTCSTNACADCYSHCCTNAKNISFPWSSMSSNTHYNGTTELTKQKPIHRLAKNRTLGSTSVRTTTTTTHVPLPITTPAAKTVVQEIATSTPSQREEKSTNISHTSNSTSINSIRDCLVRNDDHAVDENRESSTSPICCYSNKLKASGSLQQQQQQQQQENHSSYYSFTEQSTNANGLSLTRDHLNENRTSKDSSIVSNTRKLSQRDGSLKTSNKLNGKNPANRYVRRIEKEKCCCCICYCADCRQREGEEFHDSNSNRSQGSAEILDGIVQHSAKDPKKNGILIKNPSLVRFSSPSSLAASTSVSLLSSSTAIAPTGSFELRPNVKLKRDTSRIENGNFYTQLDHNQTYNSNNNNKLYKNRNINSDISLHDGICDNNFHANTSVDQNKSNYHIDSNSRNSLHSKYQSGKCNDIDDTLLVRAIPVHRSRFHSPPLPIHQLDSLTRTWDQSDECHRCINNSKTNLTSSSPKISTAQTSLPLVNYNIKNHSTTCYDRCDSENCSNGIAELDKRFIETINRIQLNRNNPDNLDTGADASADAGGSNCEKLICCTTNVTAVRETATLFTIGDNKSVAFDKRGSSNSVGQPRELHVKAIEQQDFDTNDKNSTLNLGNIGSCDTCAEFKSYKRNQINCIKNSNNNSTLSTFYCDDHRWRIDNAKNSVRLTSISPPERSHSKNDKKIVNNNNNNNNNKKNNINTNRTDSERTEEATTVFSGSDNQTERCRNQIINYNNNNHRRRRFRRFQQQQQQQNGHQHSTNNNDHNDCCVYYHSEKLNLAAEFTPQNKNNHTNRTPAATDALVQHQHENLVKNNDVDEKSAAASDVTIATATTTIAQCSTVSSHIAYTNPAKKTKTRYTSDGNISITDLNGQCQCDFIVDDHGASDSYNKNANEDRNSVVLTTITTSDARNRSNCINDECMLFEHKAIPVVLFSNDCYYRRYRRASLESFPPLSDFVNRRNSSGGGGGSTRWCAYSKENIERIASITKNNNLKAHFVQSSGNGKHEHTALIENTNCLNGMEKQRRNTLDRWQLLRFGRRSASNPPEDKKASSSTDNESADAASKRSSDKTERLRELTELLKGGNRHQQSPQLANVVDSTSMHNMPPIPPPRKPRHPSMANSGSIEKFIDTSASESGSPVATTKRDHSGAACETNTQNAKTSITTNLARSTAEKSVFHVPSPSLIDTLRPNSSVSNLERIYCLRENDNKSKLPIAEENSLFKLPTAPVSVGSSSSSGNMLETLPRAESRTIIGSYTQKTIPFRSASFSQVDYSSGKYIRSALGALKASLTKSKQPTTVIENANLTLPRKKDKSRSSSPCRLTEIAVEAPPAPPMPPYDIWIPLKAPCDKATTRNEMNLNLLGATSPNVIMEEDNENSPTADSKESKYMVVSKQSETKPLKLVQASEMVIDSPCDEELAVQSVDDFFQTATTCLIPVPVYECAVRDWVDSHLADKWINACEIDSAKILEEIKVDSQNLTDLDVANSEIPEFSMLQDVKKSNGSETNLSFVKVNETECNNDLSVKNGHAQNNRQIFGKRNATEIRIDDLEKAQSPTLDIDDLPAIAVTPGSSISGSSFEEVENALNSDDPNRRMDNVTSETGSDYVVEVRKRYSNDDKNGSGENRSSDSTQSTSTSGTNSPKSNLDEKRRIDKSKRRKGIYIQWAALDKHNKELGAVAWSGDSLQENKLNIIPAGIDGGQPMWPIAYEDENLNEKSSFALESPVDLRDFALSDPLSLESTGAKSCERMDSSSKSTCLSCGSPDENQTPGSIEAFTPDSEYNRPAWPNAADATRNRRQSFSLQSSEEKDESPSTASPPSSKPHQKLFVLRSDSISDNELSDRTPPPRDRASQSPAPGEKDLKRYSKRPLRGPYGQMLEAEMKKPAKQNYDGLLEELNRSESPYMLSAKHRDLNLQSFDDISPHHGQRSTSFGKSTSSRKSNGSDNNSLPIPIHTRAASTPAHIETPTKSEHHHQYHKRFPSCVETTPRHNTSDPGLRKEVKKFSVDSYNASRIDDDRQSKRASSEAKEKITKRNSSSPAAISLLNVANEKLQRFNLDDLNRNKVKQKANVKASPELLAELLKGSSEKMTTAERGRKKATTTATTSENPNNALPAAVLRFLDTRTHIVVELFNTEKSYVESLETVVHKYLNPLKSQENAAIIDTQTVDEIFLMVPAILNVHQRFLDELRCRLEIWEPLQRVGDAFVQVFSTSTVLETYTLFVNNVNRAKAAIRATSNQRPAFARFLETMAREHKGKLTLDNLLIKPVQKFPNYELMFSRLIKHTDDDHPDQKPLQEALKLVHDILLHLNCKEREALENDQREAALRELEGVIEGISDLVSLDRQFLSFDLVSMPHGGQGGRKERGFFLFNDLLIITSIKRRSGTIKKPTTTCPTSVASTLDTNKYKLLMKVSIEDLDIIKAKDENLRKIMREIENLTDDVNKLQQILEVTLSLRCQHQTLEENIKDLQKDLQRQLNDRQSNDSQLCVLELSVNPSNGPQQHMTVLFPKSEKRARWEKAFYEIKQKITAALDRHPIPEFIASIPIRKTRAGLQFTCAASTLGIQKDVWVCNSDGYVGQVCVLSLVPEPTVTSCNGVCNARILCVASVPAFTTNSSKLNDSCASIGSSASSSSSPRHRTTNPMNSGTNLEKKKSNVSTKSIASNDSSGGGTNSSGNERDIQLDSSSSSDDSDEMEPAQPLRRLNSTKASSTPQLSTSAPNSSAAEQNPIGCTMTDEAMVDTQQHSTMWLGTEDGCIHVYNCTDNIRTKKNKIKIQQISAIYSILYLGNRVFVSLANGELVIYSREQNTWNTSSPQTIPLGSATNPISNLLSVNGKLWCSVQGTIKIISTSTLQVENQIQISSDIKPITNMAVYNNQVWISVQNSAQIKCFHSKSLVHLFEVNLAPSVNKMLSNCDDIIRQHKAACLRVTSLLACKDLIWIGTSAGVILTISVATCKTRSSTSSCNNSNEQPIVTGIPYGHTGHVRFLTCVDYAGSGRTNTTSNIPPSITETSSHTEAIGGKKKNAASVKSHQMPATQSIETSNLLIISGGDGYEDFRNSGTNPLSEVAGREDSTNHLLLWQV